MQINSTNSTTSLMIKTHKITGLKYFCKTIFEGEKRFKYRGSGKYWKRHLQVHGRDVDTEILAEFPTDDPKLVEVALKFSEDNKIVESEEWANLIPENGLDGGGAKGTIQPKEANDKRRKSMTGRKLNHLNEESKRKISISKIGSSQSKDHKNNISKALKGKAKHSEFGNKVSESNRGKFVVRDLRTGETYRTTKDEFNKREYLVGIKSKRPNYGEENA